jgi:uncharacterized repeat protein (TIGR02543 family)
MFINVNGTWKSISDIFLNVSGTWKRITRAFINVAGTWRELLIGGTLAPQNQVTISKSTNATTFLVTLTGTNYYWSPGPPGLTYKFQWSTNSGSTWTDISSGSTSNPAFGSSNTEVYTLSPTAPNMYVTPNVLNLYRFKVDATYGSLSATSESGTVSVQGPTNVSLSTTTIGGSSVGLSWTASTGAGAYLVYYSTNDSTYTLYSTVLSGTTTETVSGLSGTGTLYYFKVLPITGTSNANKGYNGNFSNTVSTTLATHTVTFNGNGGSSGTTQTIPSGTSLSLPSSSRTGFTFNGWYTASSGGSFVGIAGTSYTPTTSITLFAQWTAITFTVTWDANGGSVSPASNSGVYGATITAPTPTRVGHTFLYWRNPASGGDPIFLSAGASYTIIGTITWTAIWSINTYTVTYNEQGGTTVSDATVNHGSSTTLPSISRSGFTFNGWYSASSGGTFLGNAGTSYGPVTSSVTIYAQWTAITFTVNWNANGGTVSPTSNSGTSGTVVTTPTPTRSGFTFLYWASSPSGDFVTGPTAGSSYTITSNTTWYARWAVPLPVISTIVARNGGTGGAYKMQYTITSTNTTSYTSVIRYGPTTATANSFANTHSSSIIQTNLGNTINDYYIIELTPWSGAGGTGSAGVMRTTTIKRNVGTPITNTTNNY